MANYTPQEITEILNDFFNTVGARQYIGARYVPIIGRRGETSAQWDNSAPYEPLTIVLYQGNSYTSRQYVPTGIAITNTDYWAVTGNYNAQIEQYRQEVTSFDSRISSNTANIEANATAIEENATQFNAALSEERTSRFNADNSIRELLPNTAFTATNTVKKYIDDKIAEQETTFNASLSEERTSRFNADNSIRELLPNTAFTATNTVKKYIDDKIAEQETTFNASLSEERTIRFDADNSIRELLPNTAFTATNTVKKYIDDKIAEAMQNSNNSFSARRILCIGDSLTRDTSTSAPAGTYWPTWVHNQTGATMYNFAVAGSGYTRPSTFLAQVENAHNSTSFADSSITDVIVLGGINDWEASYSVLQQAMQTLFDRIRVLFTNADIHCGIMIKGCGPLGLIHANSINQINYMQSWLITHGVHILPRPWSWCMRGSLTPENDDGRKLHVNDVGQRVIAGAIIGCLQGCSQPSPEICGTLNPVTAYQAYLDSWNIRYQMVNGYTNIFGRLTFKSEDITLPYADTQLIALPDFLCSSHNTENVLISSAHVARATIASGNAYQVLPRVVLNYDSITTQGMSVFNNTGSKIWGFDFSYPTGL